MVVIGGGPGGLEAARVAALRGHEVVLYEKDKELGGQLKIASVPPHKGEINDLTAFLVNQVKKNGVIVETNKEATAKNIREIHPDAVIVATGSEPFITRITGVDQEKSSYRP